MSAFLLTSDQMRQLEQRAMATGGVTGLDLMERAGRGVVAAIEAEWPELAAAPGRAVVLCGPGNNGGDGFVIARLLQLKGWLVTVVDFFEPGAGAPDAATNRERWVQSGGGIERGFAFANREQESALRDADLVVDAIFGTGLTRSLGALLGQIDAAFRTGQLGPVPRLVAVDLPSGLCSDSGRVLGAEISAVSAYPLAADLTVTFHSAKLGHVLADGPGLCGKVALVDIGLESGAKDVGSPARAVLAPSVRLWNKTGQHKFESGHALILSGGRGRSGAARLAARAALRIGAGLVTLAAPQAALAECAAQLTAIMLRRCDDAAALGALLKDPRLNTLCLGPGLGTRQREADLVHAALATRRALVLDADALTLIAQDSELWDAVHRDCVMTPHMGEFARLFPDLAVQLREQAETGPAFSKVDAAREAASRLGCTIVLKGPDTVIADPSGGVAVHGAVYDRAVPWLATAGAGDVLAGLIAGGMARGLAPFEACEIAIWLHVEAAQTFGPGLIAEDLPDQVPKVLRGLLAATD